jgi:hypothetical protein
MSFVKAFLLLAVALSLHPCPVLGSTVYDIANYSGDQGGWTLAGTITTLNVGSTATVESVNVTLSNGSQSDLLDVYLGSSLAVVGNSLVVPAGGGFNIQAQAGYPSIAFQEINMAGFADYIGGIARGENLGWSTYYWDLYPTPYNDPGAQPSVPGDHIGSAPMIVGTAVPEPSAFIIFGSGATFLAWAAYLRGRRDLLPLFIATCRRAACKITWPRQATVLSSPIGATATAGPIRRAGP